MRKLWTPVLEWKVSAETEGMLTLPPDRAVLQVGNVEIRLKEVNDAIEETRPVFTALRNVAAGKGAPLVPYIRLVASVVVAAGSAAEAQVKGYALIEDALDVAMLASGGQIAPAWVTDVFQVAPEDTRRRFTISARAHITKQVVWDECCDERLPWIQGNLGRLSENDTRRLQNALRWWRRGCMEKEANVHFLFLWFALEALSGMSFVRFTDKRPRCKSCQRELTCLCGADQNDPKKVRARDLLVETTGMWSNKEYRERWALRCQVMHGTIGISPTEEQAINEVIWPLHQTVEKIIHGLAKGEYIAPAASDAPSGRRSSSLQVGGLPSTCGAGETLQSAAGAAGTGSDQAAGSGGTDSGCTNA
jgi:hypothetical protein